MIFTPISKIPDISFWQDVNATLQKVNFDVMWTQSDGVIIRAGQRNWIDEDFTDNWKAAKVAKLKRGSYWFYDSRETPQKQAELWALAIGTDLPEWGLWIDLEESYNGAYKGEANWKKFAEAMRARFPNVKIGVYTGNWWWQIQTVVQADYWASFPLWVAEYTDVAGNVTLPYPWRNKGAVLWQFTAKGDGLRYGAESLNIDLNHTSQAFYDLFGDIPPIEEPMPIDKHMRVTGAAAPSLNIRSSGANLGTGNDLGTFNLLPDDIIHVVESNAANYQRFDKLYRNNALVELPTSPTGQYWALAVSGTTLYLMDVVYTPPNQTAKHVLDVTLNGQSVYHLEFD